MSAKTRILGLLIFPVLIMTACHTAQKFVESGDYDGAIEFCVRKLRGKSKKKTEYVQGLELAFRKAQSRDLAIAKHLVDDGRPENWERINAIHKKMAARQRLIAPLTPLVAQDGYRAQFDFLDVAALERESRTNAAEYLYNRAKELLAQAENGDKQAARDAYSHLQDLERKYYNRYKDTEALKRDARELGTTYVLFQVKNQSGKVLPREFFDQLLSIGAADLNSDWKAYYFNEQQGAQYDYRIAFNVRQVDISPERIHERRYVDEKEIQDGWEYVLDAKGNVLKDSLGNDVKTPRKVFIRASVVEVYQTKAAQLGGMVAIYNGYNDALLDSRNLATEIRFEHYASTFTGDRRALSEASRKRIGNAPAPFPRDEDMLVQAADRLKPNLREELRKSKAIF
ncbi:MAG: hypothetical protein R2791_18580 [Saprospiraceae bacterium]